MSSADPLAGSADHSAGRRPSRRRRRPRRDHPRRGAGALRRPRRRHLDPHRGHVRRVGQVRLDEVRLDQVRLDQVRLDEVRLDQVRLDEVRLDQVRLDEVRLDRAHRGAVTAGGHAEHAGAAEARQQPTVVLAVAATTVAATACLVGAAWPTAPRLARRCGAFVVLAALTDLREVRLPVVGIVTLSFVPVLAALIELGLWEALVVAAVSGAATAGFTRDPLKVTFNVANYVVSTFAAGLALPRPAARLGGLPREGRAGLRRDRRRLPRQHLAARRGRRAQRRGPAVRRVAAQLRVGPARATSPGATFAHRRRLALRLARRSPGSSSPSRRSSSSTPPIRSTSAGRATA